MTLPYQFVDSLKSEVWQKLPSPWLNSIQRKIKNGQNNSIQRIWVIRLLGTKDVLPGNDMVNHLPAINESYIYKIYMDKLRFYVNYGQTSNIIGDEAWMKSEVHCLCNLSSHRVLMLTLVKEETYHQQRWIVRCWQGFRADWNWWHGHCVKPWQSVPIRDCQNKTVWTRQQKSNGTFHLRQTLLNYDI